MTTIYPTLRYRDAKAAIAWLTGTFGLTEHSVMDGPDGTVSHAELAWGDSVVMLGTRTSDGSATWDTGKSVLYLVTDDPDGLHKKAVDAGAEIVMELTDQDYGSREFAAADPEGNIWAFGTYQPKV
jgi:uncharacterized glyoxalase superfamily protein PhnB